MDKLRLGAKAEGTKTPASLPKKGFLGFIPMSPDTLEKTAWLFLQANSGRGRLSPEAKAVVESLDDAVAQLRLQINEAYAAGYSPSERMKMEKTLSIYQGTFEQLYIYEQVFASLCGPREVLEQESADVKANAEQRLQTKGVVGFLEKNVLPLAVGALTGGAAVESGLCSWLAAQLSGLMGAAAPFLQPSPLFVGMALAGAAIWAVSGMSSLRTRSIEKKRLSSMRAIGKNEQEIQKAIVGLVMLEYQRLATLHAVKVGTPVESTKVIHRKMEQLVFKVKDKHGFELPLPAEVERDVWPLLHKRRASFLEKAALLLHAHLEILFGRREKNGNAPSGNNCPVPVTCLADARSMCMVS
ncbi:MAG: hypothetical protein WCY41_05920 [Candidatus Micrarchaeia archaeon]